MYEATSYAVSKPVDGALPVIAFHGINTSCKHFMTGSEFLGLTNSPYGNRVYCAEYGAEIHSIFHSIGYLTERACQLLEENADRLNLKNGFYFYGSSQGCIMSRTMIEQCSLGAYARGLILSGGPNMGISRIPATKYENVQKILNDFAEDIAYGRLFKNIAPIGYFRSTRFPYDYFSKCQLLPTLNNEINYHTEYKARMIDLDFVVAVKYLQDQIIIPLESSHFGYFSDKTQKHMTKMEDTDGKFFEKVPFFNIL